MAYLTADTVSVNQTIKKLQGKVVVVTGGASGIGEVTARKFVLHGARAVVIADIQDELGQTVVTSLGPGRSTYIHCDVTDEDQVRSLIESTVKIYGRLDVMFSNAGIGCASQQTVLELDLSNYDKVMAVNARGMAACVKHAAKVMVEGGVRGSIVCMASAAAGQGGPIFTDYTMSKDAVMGLMRSASLQLGANGIRVNCGADPQWGRRGRTTPWKPWKQPTSSHTRPLGAGVVGVVGTPQRSSALQPAGRAEEEEEAAQCALLFSHNQLKAAFRGRTLVAWPYERYRQPGARRHQAWRGHCDCGWAPRTRLVEISFVFSFVVKREQ